MRVDMPLRTAPFKRECVQHPLVNESRASGDVLPGDILLVDRQQQVVNRQAPIDWLPGPHGWAGAE